MVRIKDHVLSSPRYAAIQRRPTREQREKEGVAGMSVAAANARIAELERELAKARAEAAAQPM
jgi:hypothetical protein